MLAGLPPAADGFACRALADARSGVLSAVGERDGRSGLPRGVVFERLEPTEEAEGDEGGDEPGEELDALDAALWCALRLRVGVPALPRQGTEARADGGCGQCESPG